VLGLVFRYQARDWLGEHLRNDLFCVKWDVNLNSINLADFSVCIFIWLQFIEPPEASVSTPLVFCDDNSGLSPL